MLCLVVIRFLHILQHDADVAEPFLVSLPHSTTLWVVQHNAGSVWAAIPQGPHGTANLIRRFLWITNLKKTDLDQEDGYLDYLQNVTPNAVSCCQKQW